MALSVGRGMVVISVVGMKVIDLVLESTHGSGGFGGLVINQIRVGSAGMSAP
jgi:hypothetical protein